MTVNFSRLADQALDRRLSSRGASVAVTDRCSGRLGCKVSARGVSGYGPDQAVLAATDHLAAIGGAAGPAHAGSAADGAQALDWVILAITLENLGRGINSYRPFYTWLEPLAHDAGVAFFDLRGQLPRDGAETHFAAIHYSAAGNDSVAEAAARWLVDRGARRCALARARPGDGEVARVSSRSRP